MTKLTPKPLTRAAFAPFGDVIETAGAEHFTINEGTTERFHDLARVDVESGGGRALINVFRVQPLPLPISITMMERHPLGSQAFVPLGSRPFLVIVAPRETRPNATDLRAFLAEAGQGVNYAKGVWHHPVLALESETDFLVVDRGGPGDNVDVVTLEGGPVALVI
jgi:ureidoglycolate lyase